MHVSMQRESMASCRYKLVIRILPLLSILDPMVQPHREATGEAIRSGGVGRLRQGLHPTGTTRLAAADYSLCHRINHS